ncbi:MAG: CHAD domain-containing protein [bacterium]
MKARSQVKLHSLELSGNRDLVANLHGQLIKFIKNISKLTPKSRRRQIHQLRVQSRRLRAWFSLLKTQAAFSAWRRPAKGVKKLTGLLSPIRSLDVSDLRLQAELKKLPKPLKNKLKFCHQALRTWRREARQGLEKKVQKVLRRSLVSIPKPNISSRVASSLPMVIEAGRTQATDRARRALADYQAEPCLAKLHRLRIQLKKLRYHLEIEQALTGRPQTSLPVLKGLQDEVGILHDLEVLKGLLERKPVVRLAKQQGAEKEWREFLHRLELEIAAGEKNFLPRHGRKLNRLLKS